MKIPKEHADVIGKELQDVMTVSVNGVKYIIPVETEVEIPDFVEKVIKTYIKSKAIDKQVANIFKEDEKRARIQGFI